MARPQAPLAVFPFPRERYDREDESQFRRAVQRALQDVVGFVTGGKTGTPAALAAGDNDDYSLGPVTDFLRLSADGGGSALTGFADGRGNRRLVIVNISANTLTLEHEDAASVATNRVITATGAAITLAQNDVAEVLYDEVSTRWRVIGTSV